MTVKPDCCRQCPITHVTEGFVPPQLSNNHELIVGEAAGADEIQYSQPFVGGAGRWLNSLLKSAKLDKAQFNIINVISCKPPDNQFPLDPGWKHTSKSDAKAAVEHCRLHHLQPFIDSKDWHKVIALGNYAMQATTGKTKIFTWRGSPLALLGKPDKPRVMPTLHPAFLMRGSNLFPVVAKDFRKSMILPPEKYILYPTIDDLKSWKYKRFVYDLEWDEWGNVTLIGLCAKPYEVIVAPFQEPFITEYRRIFETATDIYGHNIIGADNLHLDRWRWNVTARMWDTMLMQHLVQPDYKHGLAFVSSVFTNRVYWKGFGKDQDLEDEDGVSEKVSKAQYKTWRRADAIPISLGGYGGCQSDDEAFRLYNARDNAANYDIIEPIEYLLDRFKLKDIYWNVSRPAAMLCSDMGSRGLKVDQPRLTIIANELDKDIKELEQELPDGLRPFEEEVARRVPAPDNLYKPAKRMCKGTKKAGTSHAPGVEMWFDTPNTSRSCPVCNTELRAPKLTRIKTILGTVLEHITPWNSTDQVIKYAQTQGLKLVYNFKTKQLTADKNARKAWGKHEQCFVTIDKLKTASTMRNNFLKEGLRSIDRMYYNLKVHGTSEGRLSSTAQRRGIDLQIQNCSKKVKKIFIPDNDESCFLSFDIKQGENIITTWLAEDWERWERIQTPGYDEHSDLAARIFNCDCSADGPNKALRQIGKKINHGRNYGMGIRKQLEILVAEGFSMYTEKDIKEFIAIWKTMNPGTASWQDRIIELAKIQGFLRNDFGRVRWLNTADLATKALAFLPASTLADIVLRMMIGCHHTRFMAECQFLGLDRAIDLPNNWDMRLQVHDDLTFHGPQESLIEAAQLIKHVMTQPWKELRGLALQVDGQYSTKSWGEMEKLPNNI